MNIIGYLNLPLRVIINFLNYLDDVFDYPQPDIEWSEISRNSNLVLSYNNAPPQQ